MSIRDHHGDSNTLIVVYWFRHSDTVPLLTIWLADTVSHRRSVLRSPRRDIQRFMRDKLFPHVSCRSRALWLATII